jgi:hypothetical protein
MHFTQIALYLIRPAATLRTLDAGVLFACKEQIFTFANGYNKDGEAQVLPPNRKIKQLGMRNKQGITDRYDLIPERYYLHNRRRSATCGQRQTRRSLPERQDNSICCRQVLPAAGSGRRRTLLPQVGDLRVMKIRAFQGIQEPWRKMPARKAGDALSPGWERDKKSGQPFPHQEKVCSLCDVTALSYIFATKKTKIHSIWKIN